MKIIYEDSGVTALEVKLDQEHECAQKKMERINSLRYRLGCLEARVNTLKRALIDDSDNPKLLRLFDERKSELKHFLRRNEILQ